MTIDPTGRITIPLPPRSFEVIQGDIIKQTDTFESINPPEQPRLSVDQDYALRQTASDDILNVLHRMHVTGASELMQGMHAKTEHAKTPTDRLVDLGAVAMDGESTLQRLVTDLEELDEDSETTRKRLSGQIIRQKRLILLAEAVGSTANATVAAWTGSNPKAIRSSIKRAKQTVEAAADPELDAEQIGSSIGSLAGHALNSILEEVESISI